MGERNKKNKTRKCLNCTNLVGTDPSIFCHACEKGTHGHCAKVSKEQIELLEQIEGAMWFCDKCRCYAKRSIQTGLTEIKAEVDQKLIVVKDLVKQTIAKHEETTGKLVEVVQEAVKATAKQIEEAQTNTSGASYAKALRQGLFIDSIYYKTMPCVQNGIQIIRCFKCQKFGHISAKCQSGEKCGKVQWKSFI